MFKKSGSNRLGEILVNKGLISLDQLKYACKEQSERRKAIDKNDTALTQATSLGEILIELGCIDRLQLKRGLNWQLVLRKVTMAMALCAPLMSLSTGAAAAIAKTVSPVPATIEAENYTSMLGVGTETTSDTGGGLDVGWINVADWMSYSNTAITIPTSGNYLISYRIASANGGGSFSLIEDGTGAVIDSVSVPKTGGWQKWVTVQKTVQLSAGTHSFKILATIAGFNVNWFKIEAIPSASSASSASSVAQVSSSNSSVSSSNPVSSAAPVIPVASSTASSVAPTSSVKSSAVSSIVTSSLKSSASSSVSSVASSAAPISNLPLTIQAETYSTMSGIDKETTTDVGGGINVGWIDAGDWILYENVVVNVPVTGQYTMSYRVASLGGGGSFTLYEASSKVVYDTVTVGDTGDWQKWTTIQRVVTLSAGKHTFGIKALKGNFNINWFKVETTGSTSSTSSTSSSKTTSSAPSVTSSSLASSSKSSAATSNSSSSAANGGVVSTAVAGPVGMSWVAPTKRQDGTVLDITEIGGYEIRYRPTNDANFVYISINDAWTNQYNFAWLEGSYVFQVAAFDKNGVYSSFVDVVKN